MSREIKRCPRCNFYQPLGKFWRATQYRCNNCHAEYPEPKRRRARKPGPYSVTDRFDGHLRSTYGITVDDYERMHREQGGRCAVCAKPSATHKERLFVDHCHTTGEVRGLLCRPCNAALGLLRDNTAAIKAAYAYLTKGPDVPG